MPRVIDDPIPFLILFGLILLTVWLWRRFKAEKAARWRNRFLDGGFAALDKDAPRPGRTPAITPAKVQEVIRKTTQEKPDNATHWSTHTMAEAAGLSEKSVRRIWHKHGLKPHLARTFQVSNDPEFAEKLEAIIEPTMMNWPLRLCALPFLTLIAAGADNQWMQFRGPNGSGVDSAEGYPVEFSPSKNVVWKKAIPYGQSSPVVAGGRVYLTSSEGARRLTICLDAKNGNQLWQREIRPKKSQQIFRANDPASPTPVADENGVVAFFPDFGLAAYTPDGKDRWDLPLGPFKNFYGMASSPIVAGDLLVLVCDQQSGSFLLALDRCFGAPH